jgi:hypothetical protein
MNTFFEGLANQNNASITSTLKEDTSSLQAGGFLMITKGIISIELSYWTTVYKHRIDGYVMADDWGWEIRNTFVSGVKVDSLDKFNDGLTNMGLSSISKSLELTNDDIRNEVFKALDSSPSVKVLFNGKRLYNSLSIEEKRKVMLAHVIDNYGKKDSSSADAYELNCLGLSESSNTLPSLEQLIELKNK